MPINLPPGVSLHPNSSTRNRVQPTGDFVPFSVQAAVGQTNDLFVAWASDGTTKLARVTSDGTISSPGAGASSEHFGLASAAAGASALSVGNGASASSAAGVAVGASATSSGTSGIAIGPSASVSAQQSIAMGNAATATGQFAVALGYTANVKATSGIALGAAALVDTAHDSSIALGITATTTASGQLVVGGVNGVLTEAYLGGGVTSASPSGFRLHATGGSGVNIAGASLTLAGGQGTGSAMGGDLIFQSTYAGGAGSSLNTLHELGRLSQLGVFSLTQLTSIQDRTAFDLTPSWATSTDAGRKARAVFNLYETAAREALRLEASGSAAMIGFLGASAIVRPASTTDLRQAVIDLGLYTTGGATPLNLNGGTLTAATIVGDCTGAVSLTPGSSTRNRVQATGDFIPLSVEQFAGQTNDLFVAYASDGTTKRMRVLADGSVSTLARLGVGTASFTDPLTGGTDLVQMTDGTSTWGFDPNSNQPILSLTTGAQKAIVGHCSPTDGAVFGAFSNHGLALRAFGNQNCFQVQAGGLVYLGLGASLPSAQAQLHLRVVSNSTVGMLLQGVSGQSQPLLQLGGVSSTADVRYMGIIDATWADSTDATRKGRLTVQAADFGTGTTGREGLRIESNGSAAMLGVLGAPAVAQQAATADLKDAWCGFGFQVNGGATPLDLDGGSMTAANYATAIATKTANYAMVATDGTIYADATSGAFSVTLPTPVGVAGRIYTVKKIDTGSNVVTVLPNGGETLDGSASVALAIPETTLGFQSDNANWRIV